MLTVLLMLHSVQMHAGKDEKSLRYGTAQRKAMAVGFVLGGAIGGTAVPKVVPHYVQETLGTANVRTGGTILGAFSGGYFLLVVHDRINKKNYLHK